MKAIILAAGYATRLYPLTKNRPKALLTISGRPILDYICDEIETIEGIDEILVVSNHKFIGNFNRWAAKRPAGKKTTIVDDGTASDGDKLGAIADIELVIKRQGIVDDILVIAGDNFFTYKLHDIYDFFTRTGKDCIVAHEITDPGALRRMAVALLEDGGKVLDLEEKPEFPKSNIAVYATYFYRKDTLPMFEAYLAEGNKPDAPGYFPSWLYKRKDVYACIFEGECYDIGTHEALSEVRRKFRTRVGNMQ